MRKAARIFLTAGGLLVVVVALATYIQTRPTPLHPQPQSVPSATRSEPAPQWSEAVDRARQIVRAGLTEQNLPGLSVAVGTGGDVVWAEGFGWADIKERAPVTPDTRFRIGTASTALTSAAVGVLLESDRLKLDEEIQTYVPQFPKKQWPVTLRQLMGHAAGVATDSGNEGPLLRRRCERPVDALHYFANDELPFEPGTQQRHSKYGWIVVSAAIEAAAGQRFLTFMREKVFEPLGMKDTGAESATQENPDHVGEPEEDAPFLTLLQELILQPLGIGAKAKPATPNLATSYVPRSGADPRNGASLMRPHNLSCYAGAMAFFSTASDMARFGLAMNGGKLLQPSTLQLLETSQRLPLNTLTLEGAPTQAIGHDGESFGGKVVSLMMFRERGLVVALMSNISYADTSGLALKVAEAFAERSAPKRMP